MSIKNVGDVANLIAALGVILSLLFVAYEVNENTNASLAANRQSVIADLREGLLVRAQSPSLAAALAAASSGMELTPTQRSQYTPYLYQVVKSAEGAFAQYVDGQLDREYLDTRLAGLMIPDFLGSAFGRSQFERWKADGQLTVAFGREVDAKLAERHSE
ncbi:MAG: hypothetical protein ACR2QQ_06540 [Gammaproteobacteria bacterium]